MVGVLGGKQTNFVAVSPIDKLLNSVEDDKSAPLELNDRMNLIDVQELEEVKEGVAA